MWNRVAILLRTRLAARKDGSRLPIAALFLSSSAAALLCLVVRDVLGPHAYALFALSIAAAFVALPLVGELGALLVHDEASDWVRSLPLTAADLRIARALELALAALVLALGPLVVAALAAPPALGLASRAMLVLSGCGLALTVSALLVWAQALLARVEPLLIAFQTLLFAGVITGAVIGLRLLPALRALEDPLEGPLAFYPPAWFALPFAPAAGLAALPGWAALGALALLVAAPAVPGRVLRRAPTLLGVLLAPLRALAARTWVRADERATFDLVYDALPREREFVLRTYPLLGVPMAFLALGMTGEEAGPRQGLLALLAFTSATWLPVLEAHVVVSRSHRARWILDTAPVERSALQNGAFKAVVVRFVAPIYLMLAVLCAAMREPVLGLQLVPLAFLVALAVMRGTWPTCVIDPPLAVAPEDLAVSHSAGEIMLTLGVLLTLLSVAAWKLLDGWGAAAVAFAVLVAFELASDRSARARDA